MALRRVFHRPHRRPPKCARRAASSALLRCNKGMQAARRARSVGVAVVNRCNRSCCRTHRSATRRTRSARPPRTRIGTRPASPGHCAGASVSLSPNRQLQPQIRTRPCGTRPGGYGRGRAGGVRAGAAAGEACKQTHKQTSARGRKARKVSARPTQTASGEARAGAQARTKTKPDEPAPPVLERRCVARPARRQRRCAEAEGTTLLRLAGYVQR